MVKCKCRDDDGEALACRGHNRQLVAVVQRDGQVDEDLAEGAAQSYQQNVSEQAEVVGNTQ